MENIAEENVWNHQKFFFFQLFGKYSWFNLSDDRFKIELIFCKSTVLRPFRSIVLFAELKGIPTSVHSWVQRILTTVQLCAQGILNNILPRFLSLTGLGYIHAP